MPETLTDEERRMVQQVAGQLSDQFEGQLNTETIERLVTESVQELTPDARTTAWVPLLAQHAAGDRLRALLRLDSPDGLDPAVLFLCEGNAGSSQIAAGFTRELSGGRVDVFSAGVYGSDSLNPVVVEAMAEKGIDIGDEIPQPWAVEVVRAADVVVSLGVGDACPVYPGKRYVDWELDDPSGRSLDEVRVIRDDIEDRVKVLLGELVPEPA